jgi:hypothetical protein
MTVIYLPDHDSDPFTYLMRSVEFNGSPLVTDVTAEEYLQYAAHDLEDESARGSMNAMGNAKRALHLTIESMLNAYGLLAQNTRTSFPQKLHLLDAAGLFSLSILNTLNLERNVMEHEYRVPSPQRVQEVIDVGRLLLLATQRMGEYVPYECLAGWRADGTLGVVQLDPGRGLLTFFKVTGQSRTLDGSQVSVLERIRNRDGRLLPGVEIDQNPMWEFNLRFNNKADWGPVLRPLIKLTEIQRGVDPAIVRSSSVSVSMRITLPIYRQELEDSIGTVLSGGPPVLDYSDFAFGFEPY